MGVTTKRGPSSRSTLARGREKRDGVGDASEIQFSSGPRTQNLKEGRLSGTVLVLALEAHIPEKPDLNNRSPSRRYLNKEVQGFQIFGEGYG